MEVKTTKKGAPVSVIDDNNNEYVCISKDLLQGLGKPLQKAIDEGKNRHFLTGYMYALTQIDWRHEMFGDLPELPEVDLAPRKVIKIDGLDYFEDEVLERIGQLPPKSSIWRK